MNLSKMWVKYTSYLNTSISWAILTLIEPSKDKKNLVTLTLCRNIIRKCGIIADETTFLQRPIDVYKILSHNAPRYICKTDIK